ncbi:MAG: hypothetical protein AAF235_07015 [Planctomycetota bacterium]
MRIVAIVLLSLVWIGVAAAQEREIPEPLGAGFPMTLDADRPRAYEPILAYNARIYAMPKEDRAWPELQRVFTTLDDLGFPYFALDEAVQAAALNEATRAWIDANQAVVERVRAATRRPHFGRMVRWSRDGEAWDNIPIGVAYLPGSVPPPVYEAAFPDNVARRTLSQLLAADVLRAIEQDDADRVLDNIRGMTFMLEPDEFRSGILIEAWRLGVTRNVFSAARAAAGSGVLDHDAPRELATLLPTVDVLRPRNDTDRLVVLDLIERLYEEDGGPRMSWDTLRLRGAFDDWGPIEPFLRHGERIVQDLKRGVNPANEEEIARNESFERALIELFFDHLNEKQQLATGFQELELAVATIDAEAEMLASDVSRVKADDVRWLATRTCDATVDRLRVNLVLRYVVPSSPQVFGNFRSAVTRLSATRATIALARHRLKHGVIPDTLDAIDPAFASGPFPDGVSAEPLVYRRTEDGVEFEPKSWGDSVIISVPFTP